MSDNFDPNQFATTSVKEANDTKTIPIPAGEYTGVVQGPMNEKGKTGFRSTPKGQLLLDVVWMVDDENAAKVTGIKTPTVRQSVFLDTTSEGGLDMGPGRNVGLGRLREALGQNVKGKSWSPMDIIGQVAKINVSHRIVRDESTGEENTYADVKGVTKA